MKATLLVSPEGLVSGLHTEVIDLASLGLLNIQRASLVEFDNAAQLWRVHDLQRFCLHSSPSREECLNWEREHLGNIEE
jgi:hypothetical protein